MVDLVLREQDQHQELMVYNEYFIYSSIVGWSRVSISYSNNIIVRMNYLHSMDSFNNNFSGFSSDRLTSNVNMIGCKEK